MNKYLVKIAAKQSKKTKSITRPVKVKNTVKKQDNLVKSKKSVQQSKI